MEIQQLENEFGVNVIITPKGKRKKSKNYSRNNKIYVDNCYTIQILRNLIGHILLKRKYKILYPIIVGIPLFTNKLLDKIFHRKWSQTERVKWLYSRWPENEADQLWNVNRNEKKSLLRSRLQRIDRPKRKILRKTHKA